MTKELTLSSGEIALVDDIDFDFVNQWSWCSCKGYAQRFTRQGVILLHRVIAARANIDCTNDVDHRDRNRLNNQRSNLRAATKSQSRMNSTHTKAVFRGVYYHNQRRRWQARIGIKGRSKSLGLFDTPEEAAKAYNSAAKRLFGEFAVLNEV